MEQATQSKTSYSTQEQTITRSQGKERKRQRTNAAILELIEYQIEYQKIRRCWKETPRGIKESRET